MSPALEPRKPRWPRLLGGDILLSCGGGGILPTLIAPLETEPGEGKTLVTHVGQISRAGGLLDAELSEARWRWWVGNLWSAYGPGGCSAKSAIAIYRRRGLTPEAGEALGRLSAQREDQKYGWWRLLLFGFDNVVGRWRQKPTRWARKLIIRGLNRPLCSVGTAEDCATFPPFDPFPFLGHPPEETDPDDIHDEIKAHPEDWERIYPPKGWPREFATLSEWVGARGNA